MLWSVEDRMDLVGLNTGIVARLHTFLRGWSFPRAQLKVLYY